MAKGKAQFAAIPIRAFSDTRLSALQFRVLGVIAWHDRMSSVTGKGQGAWASRMVMADRAACDQTSFSSAVTALAKFGYLSREQHHFDKRKTTYRVIYGEGDNGRNTFSSENLNGFPDQNPSQTDTFSSENLNPEIGSRDFQERKQNQSDVRDNIFRETEKDISLSDVRNSAEAARRSSRRKLEDDYPQKVRASLSQFERDLKQRPEACSDEHLETWAAWLAGLHEMNLAPDITGRAERLMGMVCDTLETRGAN